jgi:hypothetical protein
MRPGGVCYDRAFTVTVATMNGTMNECFFIARNRNIKLRASKKLFSVTFYQLLIFKIQNLTCTKDYRRHRLFRKRNNVVSSVDSST